MKNTDLIPEKTLTQLEELNKRLLVVNDGLATILETSSKFTNELLKSSASLKTIADAYKALANTTTDYNEKARKQISIEAQKARIIRQIEQAQSAEGKELAVVRQRLNEANAASRVYAKGTLAAANSIEAMRVKLSAMKKEWASLDIDSAKFKQMSADINKLNADISKHEQAIGVYGRNVGNYASGFSPLNFQIQQIARELPSLTMSAQQFFLAISNNLPMLADEMNRAKEANAKLREEGEKTTPVWKQMIGGILSWQTALVVGITLLTAFGKEIGNWVKSLFSGQEAAISLSDQMNKVNESISGLGDQIVTIKTLQNTWNNLGDDISAKNKFIKDNQTAFDQLGISVTNVSEAENLLVNNTESFISALKLRAQATAAQKLAAEQYEEILKKEIEAEEKRSKAKEILNNQEIQSSAVLQDTRYGLVLSREQMSEQYAKAVNDEADLLDKEIAKQKELADSYFNIAAASNLAADEISRNNGFRSSGNGSTSINNVSNIDSEKSAIEELTLFEIKTRADAQKRIVENELRSYDERKRALDLYTNYLNKSVGLSADNQIEKLISDTMKEAGISRVQAEESLSDQIKLIRAKESNEIENILRESAAAQIDIEKDRVQGIIDQINIEQAIRNSEIDRNESNSLVDLSNQYAEGLIAQQEYEAKKTAIIRAAEEDRFAAQIAALKDTRDKLLDSESTSVEDMLAINKKIDDAQLEYHKWICDQQIKLDEDVAKREEEIAEKRKEIFKGIMEFATALMRNKTESDLEELDKQSEQNDEWANEESERIDRLEESGAISKEEADARKAAIDDQQESRVAELEKKRADINRKQAIFEKGLALAQIAMSTQEAVAKISAATAIGIMSAIAASPLTGGMPWAGVIASMGAVQKITAITSGALQAATVLATPIPQYAEGTQDHPGGLAIVGDGGRSELVYSGGSFYKTPATDTLVDLPAHSVVMPDFDKALEEVALPTIPTKTKDIPDYLAKFDAIDARIKETNNQLRTLASIYNRDKNNRRYEMILSRISHPKIRS